MSKVLKRQGWRTQDAAMSSSSVLIQAGLIPEKNSGADVEMMLTAEEAAQHFEQVEAAYANRLAEAEEAARRIIEGAQNQGQQIRDAAYKEGHASGYSDGFDSGRAESDALYQSQIAEAEEVVQRAETYRRELVGGMTDVLTGITMSAVQQLLSRELMMSPANVRDMVDNLLTYVLDSTRVEVRVHPDDFAMASAAHPKWQGAKFGSWEVVIVPDLAVSVGGCEIRTEFGRVDSRVETKLALLEDILREEWERSVKTHADSIS